MDHATLIRSRAAQEGDTDIPLWSVPLVLVVLFVCLFSGLGALGLVGPDEPRYAAIARAMAQTGDWITPRLWGTPWFEKPVLYYWTAGFAMHVFGVSEFAARLPSAVAALIAVFAMGWTALRCYGMRTAWYTLLILPASVAMIGFARAASPDMLFAGLLTAALAIAMEMLRVPRPSLLQRVAFGFFLGAAVLAKGPAAIILAGGATLVWGIIARQWLAPLRFLHPVVIAAFCATALPWYILCAMRNPDFLRVFIWQHNFQRYLTPVFEHTQPFWYYGPITLLGILPWLPLLVVAIADGWRNRHSDSYSDSPSLFLACWAGFTFLFFSLSQSKLPGYILPAIPPAMLLVARSAARLAERKSASLRIAIASVGLLFPTGIGIAQWKFRLTPAGSAFDPSLYRGLQIGLLATLLVGVLVGWSGLRGKWNQSFASAAFTVVLLIGIANYMFLPALDWFSSARPAAEIFMKRSAQTGDDVVVFRLQRAYAYELNYYFQRELPEWAPEYPRDAYVFASRESVPELATKAPIASDNMVQATGDGKVILTHIKARDASDR